MSDELKQMSFTHHSSLITSFLRLNREVLDARGRAARVAGGDDKLEVAGRELVGRDGAGVLDAPRVVGRGQFERALAERAAALRDLYGQLRRGALAARRVDREQQRHLL